MVVTILTTNRKDRYDAIKKLCCLEKPGIKFKQFFLFGIPTTAELVAQNVFTL